MRIKFDERNKAVIAEGYVNGRKVRAISVCSADDTYDKEFGSELVLAKYKYREALAKIKCHEATIKNARAEIARLMAVVENEKNIINNNQCFYVVHLCSCEILIISYGLQ